MQAPVRILMDSGSQRTYITVSKKNKLGLVPEKSEVLNLNTFGNDQVEKRRICAPLSTTLDIDRHPHLEGLELAVTICSRTVFHQI
ncbi:Hypothetical predicted protein [Paramuricea clavata]|uniref:Uncharacterized protein n=1 Tax=Paramuricea clavata TaxID=317549 RepID=A0A6S7K921_PARCT|nr:Hypothetical predicted protein [Paramuricea clavata]